MKEFDEEPFVNYFRLVLKLFDLSFHPLSPFPGYNIIRFPSKKFKYEIYNLKFNWINSWTILFSQNVWSIPYHNIPTHRFPSITKSNLRAFIINSERHPREISEILFKMPVPWLCYVFPLIFLLSTFPLAFPTGN